MAKCGQVWQWGNAHVGVEDAAPVGVDGWLGTLLASTCQNVVLQKVKTNLGSEHLASNVRSLENPTTYFIF